jgi:hypothetical protein
MVKIKLLIANILDNIYPDACWVELVGWANGNMKFSELTFNGKCKVPPEKERGGCYCGKNKS